MKQPKLKISSYRPVLHWNAHGDSHDSIGLRTYPNPIQELLINTDRLRQKKIVICFGGSTTYGWGCDPHQSYPAYLQEHLGSDYVVFNAGVTGSCLTQTLYLLIDILRFFQDSCTCIFLDGVNEKQGFLQYLEPSLSRYNEQLNYAETMIRLVRERVNPVRSLISKTTKLLRPQRKVYSYPELDNYITGQAQTYLRTQALITRILDCLRSKHYFFLQPAEILAPSYTPDSVYTAHRCYYMRNMYNRILTSSSSCIDLSTDPSLSAKLASQYLDWQHLTPYGNELLSQAIASKAHLCT